MFQNMMPLEHFQQMQQQAPFRNPMIDDPNEQREYENALEQIQQTKEFNFNKMNKMQMD